MTESEAIKAIKDNKPTSGYYILSEALDMATQALEKQISKTSCDVDKIVEELTYESSRWKESAEAYDDDMEKGVSIGLKKAIEIVKAGGKDGIL